MTTRSRASRSPWIFVALAGLSSLPIVACRSADPAPPPTLHTISQAGIGSSPAFGGVAPGVGSPFAPGVLGRGNNPVLTPAGLRGLGPAVKAGMGAYKKGKNALDGFEWCKAELGMSDPSCALVGVWCAYIKDKGGNLPEPFAAVGGPSIWPPLNEACGGTALKCCQGINLTPNSIPIWIEGGWHFIGDIEPKGGCWSAYNKPSPINCEGNPFYGPTWSPGICKPVAGSDGSNWVTTRCTCDVYPSCETPTPTRPGEPEVPPGPPTGSPPDAFTVRSLLDNGVLAAREKLKFANPTDYRHMVDVGSYRGCKDRKILGTVLGTDPTPASQALLKSDGTVNQDTSAARHHLHLIVARALQSVPNAMARLSFVTNRKWSPTQRATYLGRVGDPEAELRKSMSADTLSIVKAVYADWPMLAVPLDGEPEPAENRYDACETGTPAVPAMQIAANSGGAITLNVNAVEADTAAAGTGPYDVQVRWGDGSVTTADPTESQAASFHHDYANAGQYVVETWISNNTGLLGAARETVTITTASASAATLAAVGQVDLDLAFAGQNSQPGSIGFTVEAMQPGVAEPEVLGRDVVDLAQEQDGYGRMMFEGVRVVRKLQRFTHERQAPISELVIRPFRRGNSSSPRAEIRLGDIGLTLVDSVGLAPRSVPFRPTAADVQVHLTTGQVVPPQVSDDGRLILPATAALIKVAIPSSKLDPRNLTAPPIPASLSSGRFAELLVGKWVSVGSGSIEPVTLTDEPKTEDLIQPPGPAIPLDRTPTRTIDGVTAVQIDLAATVGDYSARTWTIVAEAIDGSNGSSREIGKLTLPFPAASSLTRVEIPSATLTTSEPLSMRALRLRVAPNDGPAQNRLRIARLHLVRNGGAEIITTPTFHDTIMLPAHSPAPLAPVVDEVTNEVLLPAKNVEAVFFFPPETATTTTTTTDALTGRPIGCRPTFDGNPNPFETSGGGCKDTRTGLVWSQPSTATISWHDAIWNSKTAGNAAPDADDDGRVNDIDGGFTTMTDSSTLNYCHELDEGGKKDWYLPTHDDLLAVFGPMLAGRSFGFDPRQIVHSSSSWDQNTALVRMLDDIQSVRGMSAKATGRLRAVCVRRDRQETHACNPSAGTRFTTSPSGCTDTSTGLTWSRPARRAMTWHEAVWDSLFTGSSAPTVEDGSRIHDYDPVALPNATTAGSKDASSSAYCHDLQEGGVSDWRLPTKEELITLKTANGALSMLSTTRPYWSGASYSIGTYGLPITIPTGSGPATLKTSELQVICVRR